MTGLFAGVFIGAIILSTLLTPAVRGFSIHIGLLDRPGGRKIHRQVTPTGGGIILLAAFILPLWVTITKLNIVIAEPSRVLVGLVLGCSFIVILGMLDDLVNLRPVPKLIGQIFAAIILFWAGFRIDILTNPLDPLGKNPIELGPWSVFFTVLWIVSLINAINLIDGLDGLASGVCLIVSSTLVLIGWQQQELQVMFLSLILTGAIAGFLRYNYSPASIFLGDSGSMFLGYTLAAISLMGARKSTTAIALLFPLVVGLMVPITDTATAILRRWWSGSPLFLGDRKHLHHRLLDLGIPQRSVVHAFYFLTLYLCFHALTFVVIPIRYAIIVITLLAFGLFLAFKVLFFLEERLQSQVSAASAAGVSPSPSQSQLKEKQETTRAPSLNHWETILEQNVLDALNWATQRQRILLSGAIIILALLVASRVTSIPENMAAMIERDGPRVFNVTRGALRGEWEQGVVIPSLSTGLSWDTLSGGGSRVFSSDREELTSLPWTGISPGLWIPLPRQEQPHAWTLSLYHSPLFMVFHKPRYREYEPSPSMATSGTNVLLWKREIISRDGDVLPICGERMTRITIQLKPVSGDHFTNNIIGYALPGELPLFEDSYLEYWMRIGIDFPRDIHNMQPQPDMRFSLQAVIDGQPTNDVMPEDQNGISGSWSTDLTSVATETWYHRRISLATFAGSTLSRLYLMLNDYPSIERNHPVFQDGRGGYFRFFIDGVSIGRTEPPTVLQ